MTLALFLTYGGSLAAWRAAGILERELALYEAHGRAGLRTTIVSYGGREDETIARPFPFIDVLTNHLGLHPRLYGHLVPWLHRGALAKVDLIKTNQLFGARQALVAGRLTRRPVLVRQGYGHVEHTAQDHGRESRATQRAIAYERACLPKAAICQFTTDAIALDCAARVPIDPVRMRIVPNYVVDAFWTPGFTGFRELRRDGPLRIAFFGRFTNQKNLDGLISAAAGANVQLLLIGQGPLGDHLAREAAAAGVQAEFPGRLDHRALRDAINGCDAYACVSHYEGHPKALIEAMTFGMPVIAADSPGISALVEDGRNGLLVAPTVEGIRGGLSRFRGLSVDRRRTMGTRARNFALARFSVEAVAALERRIFDELAAGAAKG